jgi:serine/threonine protein kinase
LTFSHQTAIKQRASQSHLATKSAMLHLAPTPSPPTRLVVSEPLRVVRKLASGGMGDLYLAQQTGPGGFQRMVVVKALHAQFTDQPEFVRMFANEAQLVGHLRHPNIIHIYELREEPSGYVLVMEYVRGPSVLNLLRARPQGAGKALPLPAAVRIAISVAEALHHAYTECGPDGVPLRIIHRDVTLSNILVSRDGHVKLIDFGVAKALTSESMTRAGTVKGKASYLSPEQLRNRPIDHRADQFALAVSLWEMTVGERLFHRETELQTLHAILHEPYPRPSTVAGDYPADLEAVVLRALAPDRDERFADHRAFADALRAVARAHGWDVDAAPLAAVVAESLPEERSDTGLTFATGTSQPTPFDHEVSEPSIAVRPSPSPRWRYAVIGLMTVATAVFWLFVVPHL